ncbi:hypothetical protein RHMOL_Rhmol13G0057700 [Rhododendron molle]|uniref:Uncharacterized protein n=1 Tax=Rhododendron molle TaxID=49168 RepID=A0ACC0L4R5_RHOML|nr:hypothetical protein RHMOL_Rhmol13G0057700 [Rhododendron molle]
MMLCTSESSDHASDNSDLISAMNGSRSLVAEMRSEPSDHGDCDPACRYRCSKASDPGTLPIGCLLRCFSCCGRCLCVPSGTSGLILFSLWVRNFVEMDRDAKALQEKLARKGSQGATGGNNKNSSDVVIKNNKK